MGLGWMGVLSLDIKSNQLDIIYTSECSCLLSTRLCLQRAMGLFVKGPQDSIVRHLLLQTETNNFNLNIRHSGAKSASLFYYKAYGAPKILSG